MHPLTNSLPKCLLPVGDNLVIDHLLDSIIVRTEDEVMVVTGFLTNRVWHHVADSYRDPAAVLFDEATSALDNQIEAAINDAIRTLSDHKTIVVIAHKEASLHDCQRIATLRTAAREVLTMLGDQRLCPSLPPETSLTSAIRM